MVSSTRFLGPRTVQRLSVHIGHGHHHLCQQNLRTSIPFTSKRTLSTIIATAKRPSLLARKDYDAKRFDSGTPACPTQGDETHSSNDSSQSARMRIQFKCVAPARSIQTLSDPSSNPQATCDHLNTHEFSSQAFHHGIVLVQCPACLNRHLIADHLQWFTSNPTSDDPNFQNDYRTIIDLMRAKGESVKRGRVISGSYSTNSGSNSSSRSEPKQENKTTGEVIEYYP